MTQTQLIIVIVVAVVVIAVLVTLVVLRIRKMRRIAAMGPEERELYEAELHYRSSVELAQKTLETTEQTWAQRVKEAEESLKEARRIGYRPLGSLEKVELFEDHLETPEGAFQLANGPVTAVVDTAEQLAATHKEAVSRAGKEILRELMAQAGGGEGASTQYLLIETPIFVTVRRLRDGDVVKARQFASSINNAAISTTELTRRREEATAAARLQLDQVKADMETAVAAARQELERVEANTGRLDAARRAYEAVKGTAGTAFGSAPDSLTPGSASTTAEDTTQTFEKGPR